MWSKYEPVIKYGVHADGLNYDPSPHQVISGVSACVHKSCSLADVAEFIFGCVSFRSLAALCSSGIHVCKRASVS